MSGMILNVTELNSNANHLRNRQNDIGGGGGGGALSTIIVENIDEKQNDSSRNSANETPKIEEITEHRSSTTESFGSSSGSNNNRSITSGHLNDGYDSSEFNSNSDADSDFDDIVLSTTTSPPSHSINLNQSSSSSIMMIDKTLDGSTSRNSSILCANNDIKPNIGSIAVQNSSDITFGNKTFYQGPVTIKQFVYDKNKWKETDVPSSEAGGVASATENDNLGFINGSTDKLSRMKMENCDKNNDLKKKWRCTTRQSLYGSTLAGILGCLLLALIVIVKYSNNSSDDSSVLHIGDGDDSRLNIPIKTNIGDIISDTAGPLRIISRKEWLAQPPNNKLEPLALPVPRVIIAHTATENCTNQGDCTFQVRTIQTFHIESRGWDDIGYNFLVGGDGAIYVGRGWDTMGAHTKGFNWDSVCFAFIGTFNTAKPPKRQLVAAQKMIAEGLKLKKLKPDYGLYGHRQFFATQSPGTALYEIIQTWDHWTPKANSTQ